MYDYSTLKERLKKKTAKDLFCSPEELSDDQKSYIDSMAWELSGLYAELEQSNNYITERLLEKVQPEKTNRAIPNHTIVQIDPAKSIVEISKEECFYFQPENRNVPSLYFSPLCNSKVFKANLKYKVCHEGILDVEGKIENPTGIKLHKSEVWLGIELDSKVDTLDGLSLFFEPTVFSSDFRKLLPLTQVEIKNQQIQLVWGIQPEERKTPVDFQENLWLENTVEAPVFEFYKNYILQLLNLKNNDSVSELLSKIPTGNSELDHPVFSENLLWIKLSFPFESTMALAKSIHINSIPVLNRKLVKKEVELDEPIKIIPLTQRDEPNSSFQETFLSIDRIYSVHKTFEPCLTSDFEDAPSGTYGLKFGKGKQLNLQDAKKRISDLIRLLKEETTLMSEIFNIENRSDLEEPVRELQQKVNQLERRLIDRKPTKPYYFVFLKSDGKRENLWVHYWVTQGKEFDGELGDGKWSFDNKEIAAF